VQCALIYKSTYLLQALLYFSYWYIHKSKVTHKRIWQVKIWWQDNSMSRLSKISEDKGVKWLAFKHARNVH